ncbi:MucR family transcriptional regulator [Bosea massiliensis]|uniref:MucR family transcriptional regulator n=1 Tax=Bosea massiliensis TaxID=151419 RepID=A0ABW0PCJ3_9HYPH
MRRSGLVVPNESLTGLAADIVSAYVGSNSLRASDLPDLIASVYAALGNLKKPAETVAPAPLRPAVPIRSSVTSEAIICLEDGKRFKTLKRHLGRVP